MSTPLRQNLTFPQYGRLLWGAPSSMRDKDRAGKPLVTKAGGPRTECAFGVGYPKNGTTVFWQTDWGALIYQVGRAGFPNLFQPDGTLLPGRKFSWKIIDGDSDQPNENGNIPRDQEGYAGHWIVAFKSQFAPTCYRNTGSEENPVFVEIPAAQIKTGHYVTVAGSIDTNGDASKPGVYVNHGIVFHDGAGKEIVSGPDPVAAFKGRKAAAAPAGLQILPAGGLPGLPAGAPAPGVPAATSAPLPGVPAALPGVPGAAIPTAVVPNTSILGAGAPAAPAAPTAPAAPAVPAPGPVMTAKAGATPYQSFKDKGWTDDALRQHGYMV